MSLHSLFEKVRSQQLERSIPTLNSGDIVRVGILIEDGNKRRVQVYQGTLISQHRSGPNTTITVRRTLYGVNVERVFPIYSPLIRYIEVLRRSKVRRAKLYYLRSLKGKATRLRERF
jgi:large subunit ribosomal protein L19